MTLTLNASWPHVKPEIIYRTVTVLPPTTISSPHVPSSSTPETEGYQNDNTNTHIPIINIERNLNSDPNQKGDAKNSNIQNSEPQSSPPTPNKDSAGGKDSGSGLSPGDRGYNFTALNMLDLGRRTGDRYFNLTELIGAIIGTHVCTLLLCLIFMPIYYKRKWRQERERLRGLEKSPNETLYLNGLGHQPYRDYLDTPTPTKR